MTGSVLTTAPSISSNAESALVYNGVALRQKGEMLSLTDMWKAAGSDEAKRPANWARKEGADFIAHMDAVLNVPERHIITGTRGRNGVTFAHWQVGLAYAKYLSPEFHMWCNSVVRAHMEGGAVLPVGLAESLERTLGICKMLAHKITEIEKAMPALVESEIEARLTADPRIAAVEYKPALAVVEELAVPQKGRGGFVRKVSARLRRYSNAYGHPVRQSSETGKWLFHADAVRQWVRDEGKVLAKDHIEARSGQPSLLVFPGRTG